MEEETRSGERGDKKWAMFDEKEGDDFFVWPLA